MIEHDLEILLHDLRQRLLNARTDEGIWEGRLSSSPLATAVAIFALYATDRQRYKDLIEKGLLWLAKHQQAGGGWGDAENLDPANLSSTLLCYASIQTLAPERFASVLEKARAWTFQRTGATDPRALSEAVYDSYGPDRTFAVPILSMCALAGMLGSEGWQFVKPLPFELALLPRSFFRILKLTVVSYALPALIAVGNVKNYFDPSANVITNLLRRLAVKKTLLRLTEIQPSNGGFLEAVPLTAFVVMSLASMEQKKHPVVQKGVKFLIESMRSDGGWPIDTNLSLWCTSMAINSILTACPDTLPADERKRLTEWYISSQFQCVHPFTGAAAGGWGWTPLPGSVPDADDTAGALIALYRLALHDTKTLECAQKGLIWLMDLQNKDGGVPTFCTGWGRLEFDRSCPDITAHTIQAWQLWSESFPELQPRLHNAIQRAARYLRRSQLPDGSWNPLWFGNPRSANHANPVYGTARVLSGLAVLKQDPSVSTMIEKTLDYLLVSRNPDFGWGSCKGSVSTIEETCSVVTALGALHECDRPVDLEHVRQGCLWLADRLGKVGDLNPSPIGLYFAKLWYAEQLYPLIWAYNAVQSLFSGKK